MKEKHKCICKGNWRNIVNETQHLLNKQFTHEYHKGTYYFFGIVHGSDDYYYGMYRKGKGTTRLVLSSCVGSIEGNGWKLKNGQ